MKTASVILNERGRGKVALQFDGNEAGKMDVLVQGSKLTVYHTEVDSAYESQGFAKLLLTELVDYARKNELKIVPLCPYVHGQFRRNPDSYVDVWFGKEQK